MGLLSTTIGQGIKAGSGLLDEAVSGIKQLVKKAEDFLPWDEEVTYLDEATNGVITLAKFPDGRTSVIKLEVPEEFRGKGVAKKLQAKAMNDNPNLTGQVSSKKAATSAYNLGRRPINNPNATLEEVYAAIDDMSSVNMATPDAIKAFNSGALPSQAPANAKSGLLDEILELYKTEPLTARKMAKRSGILDEIDSQIPRPKGDVSNAAALRAEANAQRVGDADYKGQHSAPMSGDNAPLHDLSQVYPDDIYSSKGLQYYGTGDNAIDSESMDIINSLKGKPDQTVTMYRSVPSDAGDVDINAGDWVSLSESYVKQHGESALNGDYKIISKEVPANQLFTNGDSINEFGFDPSSKGLFDQYDMDLYHSTYADIDQFDPDMVDIGVHLGTPQQAKNRLDDTFDPAGGGARFKTENYREGANVMPVKVRSGGLLEMEDVGDWKDSQQVLSELIKNPLFKNDPVINDLIGYADEIQPSYYGGEMSWRDSPENREVLDEIRSHLQDKGFDTVKYLNQVENAYGSDAGLTEAATKSRDLLFKKINEIQKVAHSRGPDINSVPDPSAPNFQEKMDAFLNGKPSYTDAETVELDKLRADARFIGSAPESQADPNSYISLDPDRNVRSRFAKFESERGSLLASNPVATAAGLGGVLAMTGSEDADAGVVSSLVKMLAKGKADGTVVNYPDELIESTPFELRKAIADHNESVLGPEYRESFGDTTFYRGGGSERSALKNDVWMSSDPYQASTYAGQIGGNVMPLKVRKGDIPEVYSNSPEWNRIGLLDSSMKIPRNEYPEELGRVMFNSEQSPYAVTDTNKIAQFAKDEGFGGVSIKGLQDIGPYQRGADLSKVRRAESLMLGDGSNARSVNAAFDPAKESSRNLLASNPMATTSAGLMTMDNVGQESQGLMDAIAGRDAMLTSQQVEYLNNQRELQQLLGTQDTNKFNYADIVPMKRNKETGERSFAMTGLLRDIIEAGHNVVQSQRTGIQNQQSLWDIIL